MNRSVHFRDVIVAGTFKRFDHDLFFEAISGGRTRMRDVFDYTSPFGLIGRLADILFLKRYVRRLLEKRNAVIKGTAEA